MGGTPVDTLLKPDLIRVDDGNREEEEEAMYTVISTNAIALVVAESTHLPSSYFATCVLIALPLGSVCLLHVGVHRITVLAQ